MTFRATNLTLDPEMFQAPLWLSLAGRPLAEGKWFVGTRNMRDALQGVAA